MFEVAEYIGIVTFAISGFFVTVRNRLDFLGVLVSVFLTAFGGGIIRDVMAGRVPYVFRHETPAYMILGVMFFLIILRFHKRDTIENRPYFILRSHDTCLCHSRGRRDHKRCYY